MKYLPRIDKNSRNSRKTISIALLIFAIDTASAVETIDNNLNTSELGYWSVQVDNAGDTRNAFLTADGLISGQVDAQEIVFDYFSYVDTGAGGERLAFSTTSGVALTDNNRTFSSGSFISVATGGTINWEVSSFIDNGSAVYVNEFRFEAVTGTLGELIFTQYLDEDVNGPSNDVFFTRGGINDLQLFTIDQAESYGVSHSGAYNGVQGLVSSEFAGWSACTFNTMKPQIEAGTLNHPLTGFICDNLSETTNASAGDAFGPADIVSALVWEVDPSATTATIVTTLGGIPTPPPPTPGSCSAYVTFVPTNSTPSFSGPVCGGVGTMSFSAELTNIASFNISNLGIMINELSGDNRVCSTDLGPVGEGATIPVPSTGGYSDELLEPLETVEIPFQIGLNSNSAFSFFVDLVSPDCSATLPVQNDTGPLLDTAASVVSSNTSPEPKGPTLECNGLAISVDIGAGDSPTGQADVILGTSGADTINGLGGNDTICGLGGNDIINAGGGNDWVDGGSGNDDIRGSGGNDDLFGGLGDDVISGGSGNDDIEGEEGDDTLIGQLGDDTIDGGNGIDDINGGGGNDTIYTGAGATVGSGVSVSGSGGDDTIFGGPDADDINGGSGADTINGDGDNDVIVGGSGRDLINGGSGNDNIKGQGSRDTINGDAGDDIINGGDERDTVNGGAGNDVISGGPGDDVLRGDSGADSINGGSGNDTLVGGASSGDICNGQSGTDTAVASCESTIGVL